MHAEMTTTTTGRHCAMCAAPIEDAEPDFTTHPVQIDGRRCCRLCHAFRVLPRRLTILRSLLSETENQHTLAVSDITSAIARQADSHEGALKRRRA